MNDRQIEVLQKTWIALSELDVMLHPHTPSELLREFLTIINEQKSLNYAIHKEQ